MIPGNAKENLSGGLFLQSELSIVSWQKHQAGRAESVCSVQGEVAGSVPVSVGGSGRDATAVDKTTAG